MAVKTRFVAFDLRSGVQIGELALTDAKYTQRLYADYVMSGRVDLLERTTGGLSLGSHYREMLRPGRTKLCVIPPERIPIPEVPAIPGYIDFPNAGVGATGNHVTTPDAAALDIIGDITLVARIAPDDWTPSANMAIVAKWDTSGGQRGYRLDLLTTGALSLFWSTTGADNPSHTSSVAVPGVTDGQFKWVAATLDVNDGAGGRDARFWVSDDGTTWTQVGSTQHAAATTSIFANTALLSIGAHSAGTTLPFAGLVSNVLVKNSINAGGTVPSGSNVFNFDSSSDLVGVASGATTFTANSGHVMTVNHSGSPSTTITAAVPGVAAGWSGPRNAEPPVTFLPLQWEYDGDRWLTLSCVGLWGYFAEYPLSVQKVYTDKEQLDIPAALVHWVQGQPYSDLRLWVEPTTDSGITRTVTYEATDNRLIGEAIAELAAAEDGFEYSIESTGGISAVSDRLFLHYPQQGTLYANVPKDVTLGRFPARLSLVEQGPKTHLTMIGSGEGEDMAIGRAVSQIMLNQGYPAWPAVDSAKFEGSQADLDRATQGAHSKMLRRRKTWTITAREDTERFDWTDIEVGDEVRVNVPPGLDALYPDGLTLLQRVVGRTVTISSGGARDLTLELGDTASTLGTVDLVTTQLTYPRVGTGDSILAMSWGFGGPGGVVRAEGDRWFDFEYGRAPYTPGNAGRYSTAGIFPSLVAASQPDGWIVIQDNSLQPTAAATDPSSGEGIPPDYWRVLMQTIRDDTPNDRHLLYVIPGYLASYDAAKAATVATNAAVMVSILSTHPRAVAVDLASYVAANPSQFVEGQHPNSTAQAWIRGQIEGLTG